MLIEGLNPSTRNPGAVAIDDSGAVLISGAAATFTLANQSVTYAGGNAIVALGAALRGVSIFLHPSAGSIGVDYTGAADPATTTEWIEVDTGIVAVPVNFVFRGPITGLRIRPIASGAAATYTVRA